VKSGRTLAEARDEFIKAEGDKYPVDDAELEIVRQFGEGQRRAEGILVGGIEYQPIPDALWLQAIGKGWSGEPSLKGALVRVNFQEGSAIARTGAGFVHIRELLDSPPDEPRDPTNRAPPAPQRPKNPGGRPQKYDWDAMYAWTVEIADRDGLPERQKLVKMLFDKMIEAGWDEWPSDSKMKDWARNLYERLNLSG
jgi:hypothetical protein